MEDWIITAGAAIWSTITTGIALLYRSQRRDLKDEIRYLRKELDECQDFHKKQHGA
jgi:hypothetical protein